MNFTFDTRIGYKLSVLGQKIHTPKEKSLASGWKSDPVSEMKVDAVIASHESTGQYREIAGTKTFVVDQGTGPVVLCLHGVPTSSFLYRKVAANLAPRGYRVICFDMPGLGLSDRPDNFDYSFRGLTEFCLHVISNLRIDHFHLVVHDIGGPVGFAMASHIRNKILSITILNTWIDVVKFRKPLPMRPFGVKILGDLELQLINRYSWYLMVAWRGISRPQDVPRQEIYAYVDLLKRNDNGKAFLKIMRGFDHTSAFREKCLAGVKGFFPVQMIWGIDDPGLTYERFGKEIIANTHPQTVLTLRAGHLLQEEQPETISNAIDLIASNSNSPL